jgi:hypothetical protein
MGIHSKFLIHWTGNGKGGIESKPESIRPKLYLERLIDYYQKGLFAKRTDEAVIRGMNLKNIIRLCFTEIKLSQAQKHAERYGKLGIGFTRDFIMNKGGRPVIYIPFKAKKDGRLLEDSLKKVYDNSEDNAEIRKSFKYIMAHVKRMSNGKDEDDENYENYYEEMEWRIVHDEKPTNKHFQKGKSIGIHRLKFEASDVQLIVFPNDYIKQMALEDPDLKMHFSKHMPILVTLEDCSNF